MTFRTNGVALTAVYKRFVIPKVDPDETSRGVQTVVCDSGSAISCKKVKGGGMDCSGHEAQVWPM